MSSPKIVLYTNHLCPWAHRAHIALKEIGLEYEEVIIDLNTPREPCPIPRRRAPNSSPPPSTSTENALYRARVSFLVDAFISKVLPSFFASIRAADETERDAAAEQLVAAVAKEVEPLLADTEGKGPFFGGSEKLTLAEVQTGSFLIRILSFAKPEHGLASAKLSTLLERTPRFKRWAEATAAHESVRFIYDEKLVADKMRARFAPAVKV
ncbi:hypothetical protein N7527_002168 [Penicillium freii]|nr:hypothetical protein N7527_002168 [Penicillium freii]